MSSAPRGSAGRESQHGRMIHTGGVAGPLRTFRKHAKCSEEPHRRAPAAPARPIIRTRRHSTLIDPCIMAAWPGKLQKNTYGPPLLILLTGKLTDAVSPPPISLVCAMMRGSAALM